MFIIQYKYSVKMNNKNNSLHNLKEIRDMDKRNEPIIVQVTRKKYFINVYMIFIIQYHIQR